MARLIETIRVDRSPEDAWGAVGDIGGLEKSVPQLVAQCAYDEAAGVRTVTFTNDWTLVEPIISHDDETMTLVWTAQGGDWTHHNASMSVHAVDEESCDIRWIADVLPVEEAPTITGIMQGGLQALKETLESSR